MVRHYAETQTVQTVSAQYKCACFIVHVLSSPAREHVFFLHESLGNRLIQLNMATAL